MQGFLKKAIVFLWSSPAERLGGWVLGEGIARENFGSELGLDIAY